ncbi:MAG: hypothetical protein B7Y80_09810 [Hyphomicrobium sp. 32-62-53]|nr:MAG: hypothetical protein B7Z29_08915 [Hyphomicrobium sp. 12-62-95]OYX99871.1 MAG: hypothetical protein B7Y80_09810 [Hyphomicrobium sp. 32-62-53]
MCHGAGLGFRLCASLSFSLGLGAGTAFRGGAAALGSVCPLLVGVCSGGHGADGEHAEADAQADAASSFCSGGGDRHRGGDDRGGDCGGELAGHGTLHLVCCLCWRRCFPSADERTMPEGLSHGCSARDRPKVSHKQLI